MAKNGQARKFQLTINNPLEKNMAHEEIKNLLLSLKSLIYFCMADEIGGETTTYHTHVFTIFENPKLFSTIKNKFPKAHIESARGSNLQNRDYVFKQGKWKDTEKSTTAIPSTQEEWGELPEERLSPKPELQLLFELIKEGKSNYEILEEYPEYLFDITHIDRCRLILNQEEYKSKWRDLEVTYIYGKTGAGKSRSVMEKHGYENIFRATDYLHTFDTYLCENVLVFEEFNSSLKITDMLNYLDGYPLKLPARYSDKIATYNIVYIISNIPLDKQYPQVKDENFGTWQAFIRRINKVIYYKSEDNIIHYDSTEEYFNRNPFDDWPVKKLDF